MQAQAGFPGAAEQQIHAGATRYPCSMAPSNASWAEIIYGWSTAASSKGQASSAQYRQGRGVGGSLIK